ncbi:hypothetical protein PR048_010810 [Dryococelus australis]|uniref:DUF5641 domain-containing protein n=1 Tax=Dryococelus australis TaxID=614101 RepID=A0ABQ9I4X8_9NEOP|nr:hypothetical protein PR048_010810 [Dryococelus australis]
MRVEPLVAVPEPNHENMGLNRLQNWQLIEWLPALAPKFLHTILQRSKWKKPGASIAPNQLVFIKDDQIPPLQWQHAHVEELHPGRDGIVIATTVSTAN